MKIEEIWKLLDVSEKERWLAANGFWPGLSKHPSLRKVPHSVKKTMELNASKLEKLIKKAHT